LEEVVSLPDSPDSDPLLDFSSELDTVSQVSQGVRAPEPTAQTIAAPVDAAPAPPSIPIETLISRIARLEEALDESKIQVSTLKSELATLVRTIGDIRNTIGDLKKRARRPENIRTQVGWPSSARVSRTASAIMAAVTGLGAGIFGWTYFTGPADSRLGAGPEPARETAQETAFAPADQPVAPPATSPSLAPVPVPVAARTPASVPVSVRAPARETRVNYLGTLSVDSEPGGEVFLNRESAGHTPVRLANLKAGSHLIWVERDGYRRWTRVVQVPADRVTRLFADLEPLSAR
jgi:PEGA domain